MKPKALVPESHSFGPHRAGAGVGRHGASALRPSLAACLSGRPECGIRAAGQSLNLLKAEGPVFPGLRTTKALRYLRMPRLSMSFL